MADSSRAAGILLKLYELRTEATLRQARAWFVFEFHPSSSKDVLGAWLGPGHESAPYRMVTTYWDMAASLVVQDAIPAEMFNAANTEHVVLYAKLRPFLGEVRTLSKYPDYLGNLERVVEMMPQAEERIGIFERYLGRQRTLASGESSDRRIQMRRQRRKHRDQPPKRSRRMNLLGKCEERHARGRSI